MASYRFKTMPWPHQVKALKRVTRILREGPGAGVYVPMRYGKSKIGIDAAGILRIEYDIRRVLVVTIVSGIGVWEDQIITHSAMPFRVKLSDGSFETGNGIEPYSRDFYRPMDWRIVNYESTFDRVYDEPGSRQWHPIINQELKRFDPELLLIDEVHHIGNAGALQSKMVCNFAANARRVIAFTGTPFHRKPLLVFGQFKAIDRSVFGTSFKGFREHYSIAGRYSSEITRYRNLKELRTKVRAKVYYKHRVEQVPTINEVVPVHLSQSAEIYRQMALESFATIQGEAVTAEICLTRHLRLLQIAGGWVTTENGRVRRVGTEKIDQFTDWLSELYEQEIHKIVIGCRFIPELAAITRASRKVGYKVVALHGGVKRGGERERRIYGFNTTKHPIVFAAQVSAGKEAIDLSSASTMAFYSLPESYLDYDQFRARIAKYKETRTLAYYHFLAKGTQDEIAYASLKEKKDVADLILRRPELVEKITNRI